MGEAAGAGLPRPAPRPRPRADRVPAPARPPARLALAAPPACQGPGLGGWDASGRRGTRGVLGARPERPPSPRLARAQGTATDAAGPSPPDAPLRPDVGGCGGRAAARGRRRGGERFLPFPGAQGSFCWRFYLRSQTKLAAAAAFPRSAPARVKRWGWRPAGAWPAGEEPRSERRSHVARGPGMGYPSSDSPPPSFRPGVAAALSGVGDREGSGPWACGAARERPCQNR